MPEEKLNCSEVARLLVDLGRLRPTHRVCAIGRAIEPSAFDPGVDNPCILSCRKVRLHLEAAREEVLSLPRRGLGKPVVDRGSGVLRDFKLHRPACLFLNDGSALSNPTAGANIIDRGVGVEDRQPKRRADGGSEKRCQGGYPGHRRGCRSISLERSYGG